MHHPLTAVALLATAIPAQMSGNYTVNPRGSGTRNFKSLDAVSGSLARQGVNGTVKITVADGTYPGGWNVPAIVGASGTQKVLFQAANRGKAIIGSAGPHKRSLETVFATKLRPMQWVVLDGFVFLGTVYMFEDQRYQAGSHRDIEIRHCEFRAAQLWAYGERFHLRHNRFVGTGTKCVIKADGSLIHHNLVEHGPMDIGATEHVLRGGMRIFNNLFTNTTNSALTVSAAYDAVIAHNTISSSVTSSGDGAIQIWGHGYRPAKIVGNTIVNTNTRSSGALIYDASSHGPAFQSDSNVFWNPTGSITRIGRTNTSYKSLTAWRVAYGFDKNSQETDPLFRSSTDFRPRLKSPLIDKSVGSPPFVQTDLDGVARDGKPDIGCYEFHVPFHTFGNGCPGSQLHVPKLGSAGSPTIGSTNFEITLGKALGAAPAVLSLGVSKSTLWGSIPLPLKFGGTCEILVSLDVLISMRVAGTGAGNGSARVKMSIPNDPGLRGKSFYFQWAVGDRAAAQGLAFSDAGHLDFR